MDLWINGWYFHDDLEKRRRLEAHRQQPLSKWLFLNAVVSTSKVLLYCGHVMKVALRDGLVSDAPVR